MNAKSRFHLSMITSASYFYYYWSMKLLSWYCLCSSRPLSYEENAVPVVLVDWKVGLWLIDWLPDGSMYRSLACLRLLSLNLTNLVKERLLASSLMGVRELWASSSRSAVRIRPENFFFLSIDLINISLYHMAYQHRPCFIM